MQEIRNRKIVAFVSVLIGAVLLAMTILPPIASAIKNTPVLGDVLFFIIIVPLMSVPSLLCLWFGYQLFQRRTEDSLRWIVGTLVFIAAVAAYVRIGEIFNARVSETGWDTVGMLLVALVFAVTYPTAISRLHPAIGGERKSPRRFIGKGYLALIAWLVFFALSPAPHSYFRDPLRTGITGMPLLDAMLQLLIVLLPFLIPYCGYKIAVRFLIGEEM